MENGMVSELFRLQSPYTRAQWLSTCTFLLQRYRLSWVTSNDRYRTLNIDLNHPRYWSKSSTAYYARIPPAETHILCLCWLVCLCIVTELGRCIQCIPPMYTFTMSISAHRRRRPTRMVRLPWRQPSDVSPRGVFDSPHPTLPHT